MTQANSVYITPPTNTSADNDPQSPCNCLMCIAEGDNSPHRDRPQSGRNSTDNRLSVDDEPPATSEKSLHERLKVAGMRLQRTGNDRYTINWLHQIVVSDLTLLQAAMFVHRSLDR
jgi:hypothetical protein